MKWIRGILDWFKEPLELRLRDVPFLPPVKFKPFDESHRDRCLELYRMNAPGRFPDGVEELYGQTLTRCPEDHFVALLEGQVVASCGMCYHNNKRVGGLSYGLVDLAWQRRGIGTALLMMRLAKLGEASPERGMWIFLCAVDDSAPFYRSFGFRTVAAWRHQNGVGEQSMQLYHLD